MHNYVKNLKYNCRFNVLNNKSEAAIFELALTRGQLRGWYPEHWTVKDYKNYLFGPDFK